MTKKVAENILTRLAAAGIDATLYEGYSGRGMYGKETYGVDLDMAHTYAWAKLAAPQIKRYSVDGMGLGLIIY